MSVLTNRRSRHKAPLCGYMNTDGVGTCVSHVALCESREVAVVGIYCPAAQALPDDAPTDGPADADADAGQGGESRASAFGSQMR